MSGPAPEARPGQLRPGAHRWQKGRADRCTPDGGSIGPDSMSPVLLFIVTTSPCQDWVICAPAAFLGCGSRFSGSLSGIEP
ncbi:hypothetical protein PIB30_071750 [Stylosanthes scabra]|uniref:Uncharacterized protein n=1 Tax=Stylosanthes scabra TaxID=79078 RepID=A0ABU6RP07_9FABA|nr:hypothetical protein [Stylosanthes scabra]